MFVLDLQAGEAMREAGWGVMLFWAVVTLVFLRFWGAIDGTDAAERKRRAEWDTTKAN